MLNETALEREMKASKERDAQLRLLVWHDVAAWLDYAAMEFVADATSQGHLHHVGQCVREEGELRYARTAGLALA